MVLRLEDHFKKDVSKIPDCDDCNCNNATNAKINSPVTSDLKLEGPDQGDTGVDRDKEAAIPLLSQEASNGTAETKQKPPELKGWSGVDQVKAYEDDDEMVFHKDDFFDDEYRNDDAVNTTIADGDDKCHDDEFDDDDEDELNEDDLIPDGGWGWVVCFGSFMVNFITDGTMFSFGILLLDLLQDIGSDKATTSWAGGSLVGFSMFAGPLVSYLLKSYSVRQVTIAGAVLTLIGFAVSSFSVNIYMFIFTYGVIGGTGICMSFLPAIIVVGLYFNKKRALATGIATSGSGLGTFAYAYIANSLLETYKWRGTVLILGGLVLNCAVCGMVFRPITPKKMSKAAVKKSKSKQVVYEETKKQDDIPKDDGSVTSGYSSDKTIPCPNHDGISLQPPSVVVVCSGDDEAHMVGNGFVGWDGGDRKSFGVDMTNIPGHFLVNSSSASESSITPCDVNTTQPCNVTSSRSHHTPLYQQQQQQQQQQSHSHPHHNHHHHHHTSTNKDTASGSLFKDAILNRHAEVHGREKHSSETASLEDQSSASSPPSGSNIPVTTTTDNRSNADNINKDQNADSHPSTSILTSAEFPADQVMAATPSTPSTASNPFTPSNPSNPSNTSTPSNSSTPSTPSTPSNPNTISVVDMESGQLVYHRVLPIPNDNNRFSLTEPDNQNCDCDTAYSHSGISEFCQIRPATRSRPANAPPTTTTNKNNDTNYDIRLYKSAGHLHFPSKYNTNTNSSMNSNKNNNNNNENNSQNIPHSKASQGLGGYEKYPFSNTTRLLNSECKLDDYSNLNHLYVTPIQRTPKSHSRSSGHLKSYIHGSGHDLKTEDQGHMTASRSAYFHHQISKGLMRPILRQDIYYGGSVNHISASKQFGSVASFVAAMTRASSTETYDVIDEKAESTRGRGLTSCCSSGFLFKDRSFVLLLITFTMWTAQSVSLTYIPDLAVSRGISRPDAAFLISIVGIANVLARLLAGLVTDILRVPASWLYIGALSTAAFINFIIAFGYSYLLLCTCSAVFGLCMGVAVSMRTIVLAEELGIRYLTQSFGIVAMFQGVAFTVNPPIAGKLIDSFDSFEPPFMMVSVMYALSALAVIAVVVLNRCKPTTTFTTTTTTTTNNNNHIDNDDYDDYYNNYTSSLMLGDDVSFIVEAKHSGHDYPDHPEPEHV